MAALDAIQRFNSHTCPPREFGLAQFCRLAPFHEPLGDALASQWKNRRSSPVGLVCLNGDSGTTGEFAQNTLGNDRVAHPTERQPCVCNV